VSLFFIASTPVLPSEFSPKEIDQIDYVNEVCWMGEIQRTGPMCEVFDSDTGNFKAGLTRAQNDTRKYVLGT
jgi:hypothetical protein